MASHPTPLSKITATGGNSKHKIIEQHRSTIFSTFFFSSQQFIVTKNDEYFYGLEVWYVLRS